MGIFSFKAFGLSLGLAAVALQGCTSKESPAAQQPGGGDGDDDGDGDGDGGGGNPSTPPRRTVTLQEVEQLMLSDAQKLRASDRATTRYLLAPHRTSTGFNIDTLVKAMNKALNSVSQESDIVKATVIDRQRGIWRIDLGDYGLSQADWINVRNTEDFNIISQTDEGVLLRQLIGDDQPWLYLDHFITFALDAPLYYDLTKTPGTLNEYFADRGIDFAGEVASFDAVLAGSQKSPLSPTPGKSRLIGRVEGGEGNKSYLWFTHDPIDPAGVPERNLLEFPLVAEAGLANRVFEFFAGEYIATQPNGLQHYTLFNQAGVRQDFAPTFLVFNYVAAAQSRDPEIRLGDCHTCHNAGIIPMKDQVRAHVIANASSFGTDTEVIKALYATQPTLDKAFKADQDLYAKALDELGINPADGDPITAVVNAYEGDWDIDHVAALLFLDTQTFRELIEQSASAKAKIGILLTPGGTISRDQLADALPDVIVDLGLFREAVEDQ